MRNNLINKRNDNIFSIFDDFFNKKFFDNNGEILTDNYVGNYAIEKISDSEYVFNINVAGFDKSEIEIEHDDYYLIVKGEKKVEKNDKYVFNGFSSKFKNTYRINKDSDILEAKIDNGILKIKIKEKIAINNKKKIFIK